MKRICFFIALTAICSVQIFSQETTNVLRVNVLNPGIEYEMPVFKRSIVAFNAGVGYGGSYPELTTGASGWLYMISPFLEMHYRSYYNLEKRFAKQKNTAYNSANFWGIRTMMRGEAFSSNFTRTTDYDIAVGPTWGMQRSFGNINLLFDLGIVYYSDMKGKGGFSPMLEFNLGYNFDIRKRP